MRRSVTLTDLDISRVDFQARKASMDSQLWTTANLKYLDQGILQSYVAAEASSRYGCIFVHMWILGGCDGTS